MEDTINKIKNNETYKQILNESCGGILYNIKNQNKYDTKELLELYNSLTEQEKNSLDGIMEGVINFINGD